MEERLLRKSKLTYISQHTSKNNHGQSNEIQTVPHVSSITVEKYVYDCDSCGLQSNCDIFSDDDALPSYNQKNLCSKFHKLRKKPLSEEIQQKFYLLDKENEKIQTRVKKLMKNIDKKDKIISDLNSENTRIKQQLEETIKRLTDQNLNLIELANTNNRLKKEIEKKNADMLELKSQMNKNELIKNNLMKDIDFYKMELNSTKRENTDQLQKYSEKEYETLQKKFLEIKIENNKICRKFKEIRSADDEHCPRTQSYHILHRKYQIVQNDFLKLKMENKKLKDKIKRNKQMYDDQTNKLISSINHFKTEEIEQLIENEKQLDQENHNYKKILNKEIRMEEQIKNLTTDLQLQLFKKEGQHKQYESEILNLKTLCNQLENQIKTLLIEKEEVMKQYLINEENNNKLKLKLEQLFQEKTSRILEENVCQTEDEDCENCSLLKQELEKIGYANLRLNKEKQNLQTNFQKLSIKTSKLTLKMEELELEKQRLLHHESETTKNKCGNEETVLQQNVLLSKRLHNLLKKSEKLFHAHVIEQQQKIENDSSLSITSNNKMIDEINENLSCSKLNLENIENKLNEEEWKLNAALKHIRSVKEHIKVQL